VRQLGQVRFTNATIKSNLTRRQLFVSICSGSCTGTGEAKVPGSTFSHLIRERRFINKNIFMCCVFQANSYTEVAATVKQKCPSRRPLAISRLSLNRGIFSPQSFSIMKIN
jgi:hypothetical protein